MRQGRKKQKFGTLNVQIIFQGRDKEKDAG